MALLSSFSRGIIEMNIERDTAPMLERDKILRRGRNYWLLRRFQDIILSLLAIAVLWPFLLIIALIIVIDSPGAGPIFAQTRVGRDGKEFTFYKFRSMIPNAEAHLNELLPENEMHGPVFKIRDDPRITRVGRILRKCSIDELPQLFNVLRGDMSIVGPRPALPREVAQYDDYAARLRTPLPREVELYNDLQRQRMYVTPGLTCYWQIQPNRNQLSFDEWLELDIKYINERSFLTDWKIIFKTFAVVLGMTGI